MNVSMERLAPDMRLCSLPERYIETARYGESIVADADARGSALGIALCAGGMAMEARYDAALLGCAGGA